MNSHILNKHSKNAIIIEIDREKVKQIRSQIDTWYGKGEIRTIRGCKDCYLYASSLDEYIKKYKIEIISQTKIAEIPKPYLKFITNNNIELYDYKFYKYNSHKLSKLCDAILETKTGTTLVNYLNELVGWKTNNPEEETFVRQLLSTITIKKASLLQKLTNPQVIKDKECTKHLYLSLQPSVK